MADQFQYVGLPDGSVGQFPAGWSDLQVKQIIAHAYPKEVAAATNAKPASEREQPSPEAARSPLANAPIDQGSAYGFGAANTGGMNWADEAAGYLLSPFTGLPPNEITGDIRALDTAAKEQHPNSYLTGQVGGAVAQAAATRGAGLFPEAESLGGRMLAGAGTGGAFGAGYGAGEGDSLEERAKNALLNAGLGAVTGGVLPLVAEGAGKGYGAIKNWMTGQTAAKATGVQPPAVRAITDAMEADGTLGPTGRANIAAAGPDAMIVDAGPNARAVLDTSIQRGGPGAVKARQAVSDRTGRAAGDITTALDTAFGQPEGVTATRTAIREGSASARGNAYDAAYSQPIDYASPNGMLIEQLVKGRVPGSAIRRANELMRINGEQSKQILAHIADDGTVTFERMPDVRQLDYITRALNDVAEEANGQGKLGGTTALGRAYEGLSNNIRQALRQAVPEYGTALDTAADPIRRSKAVELGSRLLSPSVTRDQAAEFVVGMSGAEKKALAQGIRSHLDDVVANVSRTIQDGDMPAREAIKTLRDLSTRANREKIALAIGDQEATALFEKLDRAARTFDLRASVADNSKTYARMATDRRVKDVTAPGIVGTAMEGKPLNAVQRLLQTFTGRTPDALSRRQDAVYSDMADLLTRPATPNLLSALENVSSSDMATKLMQDRIIRGLSGGGPIGLSQPPLRTLLPESRRR